MNFESFSASRQEQIPLKEIREQIKGKTKEELKNLRLDFEIIKAFHTGFQIVSGDTLYEAELLLSKVSSGNKIQWHSENNDNGWSGEADRIQNGDIIKIEDGKVYKIRKNKKVEIGEVVSGYEMKEEGAVNEVSAKTQVAKKTQGEEKENFGIKENVLSITKKEIQVNTGEGDNTQKVIDAPINTTININPPAIENTPSIETNNQRKASTTYIYENGRVFLVGKNGEKKLQHISLSQEQSEQLQNFKQVALLKEVVEIWTDEANRVVDGMFFKGMPDWKWTWEGKKHNLRREDDRKIKTEIKNVESAFKTIYENALAGKSIEKSQIENIFTCMNRAEKDENIIGELDLKQVANIIHSDSITENSLPQIYNLMKYGGISGNSNLIKEKISNRLLQDEKFIDVRKILESPETLVYIKNNDENQLTQLLGNNKKLAQDIIKSFNKIKVKQEQHRADFSKEITDINKKEKAAGQPLSNVDDLINLSVEASIQNHLKNALLHNKIAQKEHRGSSTSYEGIYANIVGLGETKKTDWLILADKNIDTAIDIGTTLALSAMSMGVGVIAARGALYLGTIGVNALSKSSRGVKIANGLNKTWGGRKAVTVSKFAGTAGAEGLGFYEGANLMNNFIYSEESLFENALNGKEISKSIAFMGVLRGIGKFSNTKTIQKMSSLVPEGALKNAVVIAAEAGIITGTSMGLEILFEGEGNFTFEEYAQALIMVSLFKKFGKTKVTKTPDGKVKVSQETTESEEVKNEKKDNNKTEKNKTKKSEESKKDSEETKSEMKDSISQKEWDDFNENNVISTKRLKKIKQKFAKNKLSPREQEMYEWDNFVKNKVVSEEKMKAIANKIVNNEKLTTREESMRQQEHEKINKILEEEKLKSEEKETKNKKEFLSKISALAERMGKSAYNRLKSSLSKEGLAKLKTLGGEKRFIKNFQEAVIKKTKQDWDNSKKISGTIKAPLRTAGFGAIESINLAKFTGSTVWKGVKVSGRMNPLSSNFTIKDKIIGGISVAVVSEFFGEHGNITSHLGNIAVNSVEFGTLGIWSLLADPLINTLYGTLRGFEPRDFREDKIEGLKAFIANAGPIGDTPYALGESLGKTRLEILEETLKTAHEQSYPQNAIEKIQQEIEKVNQKQAKK